MADIDVDQLKQQVEDLLMRVELLESRVSFTEDYVRDQEAKKEMEENPEAKRSFRHA
jgi:hypothetical protein